MNFGCERIIPKILKFVKKKTSQKKVWRFMEFKLRVSRSFPLWICAYRCYPTFRRSLRSVSITTNTRPQRERT